MPSEYEDQLSLQEQGMLISRPESPALKGSAATAIVYAFREFIEHRYLYQKVTVYLKLVDDPVKGAVKNGTARAARPGTGSGGGSVSRPIPAAEERLKALRSEIEQRPWRLVTRTGDDPESARIHRTARLGTQPLETPANQMDLKFYLTAVRLRSPNWKLGRNPKQRRS